MKLMSVPRLPADPGKFPSTRMRRNRRHDWSRRLVAENHLLVDDLIWPIFVHEGRKTRSPVPSMPGVDRLSVDLLADAVGEAAELGIPAVAIFPATDPALKTADAKEALDALTKLCTKNAFPEWIESFKKLNAEEFEKVVAKEIRNTNSLKMAEVIYMLSQLTKGEAVVVTDVGQHQMVTSRYYQYKNPRTNITSGGAGTMGFALPAAMGAKVAAPHKQVVAVIGDGGYQMTVQELGTIMQYKIPVKILVLNNSFLGMVRQWQQLFHGKRYSFTEMQNPNFVKIAEAYNIPAAKVTEQKNLEAELKKMLASETSYFLEVVVEKEDNVFPMVPAGAGVAEVILEIPKH
ncbi:MAG TPA: thiamine pyrophosphate-dependent enzyme [Cyclobacteriaceae bacterium]|nr:thiamine pyrophosphate-dependent enzyme [Cyclobacteriaceae bacterium]